MKKDNVNKEDIINELIGQLEKECSNFALRLGLSEPESDIKHNINFIDIKANNFIIRFRYTLSEAMVKSILVPLIILPEEPDIQFFLSDVLAEIDANDFRCTVYPYIITTVQMTNCFKAVSVVIEEHFTVISEKLSDEEFRQKILTHKKEHICGFVGDKELFSKDGREKYFKLDRYNILCLLRLTSGAYENFLNCKYAKANKLYRKYKNLSLYEKKLVEFITVQNEAAPFQAVPENCRTLFEGRKDEKSISGFKTTALTILILTPLYMIGFALLYILFCYAGTFGAQYATAWEAYNLFSVFLPAFITAIISSYHLRRKAINIFCRKSKKEVLLRRDDVLTTYSEIKFMRGFFHVVLVCSIIFTAFSANAGVVFYKDRLSVRGSFDLSPTRYNVDEIESVAEIQGRINGYGDWMNGASYVIRLSDGSEIDLNEYIEYNDMKKKVYPILRSYGLEPVKESVE